MAKTAQKQTKDPAVTAFKESRILANAQAILNIVKLQGGDHTKIPGLSHTLYREAEYIVKDKKSKVLAAFALWKNKPICANAKKFLHLISKGEGIPSDFGIPDYVIPEIITASVSKTSQRKIFLRRK
jgi:hypothetical protein